MEYTDYNAAEARNVNQFVIFLVLLLQSYEGQQQSEDAWYELIYLLFPWVKQFRDESSRLGRSFYDSEREKHIRPIELDVPSVRNIRTEDIVGSDNIFVQREILRRQRHNIFLAPYEPAWLIEATEPNRKEWTEKPVTDKAIIKLAQRLTKEVQNGGRQTQIKAAETDPAGDDQPTERPANIIETLGPVIPFDQSRRLRGVRYARVAGGGESCGFCTMLISRGPVYHSFVTAGAPQSSQQIFEDYARTRNVELLDGLTNRFHPNCDCRVVPVFDQSDWPGKSEYEDANRLWYSATSGYRGIDALNALRREVERGTGQNRRQRRAA